MRNHEGLKLQTAQYSVWPNPKKLLHVLYCLQRPVSYTHLDVYKRQIYTGPAHFYGEVTWNIPGMNIGYGELKTIEIYDFIKAIVEGKQPTTNFQVGYGVEKVCDAVMKSSESGKWEPCV